MDGTRDCMDERPSYVYFVASINDGMNKGASRVAVKQPKYL